LPGTSRQVIIPGGRTGLAPRSGVYMFTGGKDRDVLHHLPLPACRFAGQPLMRDMRSRDREEMRRVRR
jgi:hypothetical protein